MTNLVIEQILVLILRPSAAVVNQCSCDEFFIYTLICCQV